MEAKKADEVKPWVRLVADRAKSGRAAECPRGGKTGGKAHVFRY